MNMNYEAPKPEIKIFYNAQTTDPTVVREIALGIEEEGVPSSLVEKDETDAIAMAFHAAESSHLGVGIGIAGQAVLHFIKLKEGAPLFCIDVNSDEDKLRAIGGNAARLVKRMPFKEI